MIRLTLAALVAAVIVAVSVSVVLAQTPGTITQLSGDQGCYTASGTDGGSGPCTVGRLLHEQMSLAMTPDGRFVYSMASGSNPHGIAVFSRDAVTGALSQLPGAEGCVSSNGTDGSAGVCTQVSAMLSSKAAGISPDGKNLYLVGEHGVLGFTINQTTGALSQDAGCLNAGGTGGCGAAVGVNEATAVLVSRDGKTVYVSGATLPGSGANPDAVATLSRNPDTGVLMQVPLPAGCIADSPASDAAGCRHGTALFEPLKMVESPQHDHVYVAVSEGISSAAASGVEFGAVSVMSREPDGSLTQIDCNGENASPPPAGTGCASNAWGLADATSIAISSDGLSVYVGAQGSTYPAGGPVVAFSRDPTNGKLRQVQCMSSDGADGRAGPFTCDKVPQIVEPTDIALSRDGGTLYAASSDSSGPAIFSRDASTSKLTQLPGSDGCVRTDGLNGCATGRATYTNSVLLAPGCEFVYFGGHNEGAGPPSSLTAFSRTSDCAPTSSAAVADCTTSGDVVISVLDRGYGSGAKKLHYKLDGGAEQTATTTGQTATTSGGVTGKVTVNVPEGKHSLEFWSEDDVSVVEKSHNTVNVLVDKTNPTVTIASDQKKASYAFGERASVTITAADENSGVASDPSARFLVLPTTTPGKNTVTRSATDRCANSGIASYTYTVAPPKKKSLRLSVTPRVVYTGERIRFDFKAYNPAGSARAARKGFASAQNPVKSATIRFAGHRLRTDSRGRAHITLALRRGRYKAQATRTGYRSANSSVLARTRPAVVVPQFTG